MFILLSHDQHHINFFMCGATVTSTVPVGSCTLCMLICCHITSTRMVGIGDKITEKCIGDRTDRLWHPVYICFDKHDQHRTGGT